MWYIIKLYRHKFLFDLHIIIYTRMLLDRETVIAL